MVAVIDIPEADEELLDDIWDKIRMSHPDSDKGIEPGDIETPEGIPPPLSRKAIEKAHVARVSQREEEASRDLARFFQGAIKVIASRVAKSGFKPDPSKDARKQAEAILKKAFDPQEHLKGLVRAIAPHLAASFCVGAGAELELTKQAAVRKKARGWTGEKYSPDQPRDEQGRFGEGSGSSTATEETELEGLPEVYEWAKTKFGDETKAKKFANWFGNSKVVDDDGNPLLVYHGVKNPDVKIESGKVTFIPKFDEFSTDHKTEPGIYFSPDKNVAQHYGTPVGFYLRAENIVRHEDPLSERPADADGIYRMRGKGDSVQSAWEIGVFDPTQIKLADGNEGTFDPSDPSMKKGLTGTKYDPSQPRDEQKHLPGQHDQSTHGTGGSDGEKPTLEISEVAPGTPADELKFSPSGELIRGKIAGFPVTAREYGIVDKISTKTKTALESALADKEIVADMKAAGIKEIRVDTAVMGRKRGAPENWTAASEPGILVVHTKTAEAIAKSTIPERVAGGMPRVIAHEAGHGVYNKGSDADKKEFATALGEHQDVTERIGKIVSVVPNPQAFSNTGSRLVTESFAEISAMRRYAADEYGKLPSEIRTPLETMHSKARETAESFERLHGDGKAAEEPDAVKYREDQPRDEAGRFGEGGAQGTSEPASDDSEGSVKSEAALREQVYGVEDEIWEKQEYETAVCIGADGKELLSKDGEGTQVSFTEDELKAITGAKLFTHNHPRGWGYDKDDPRSKGNSFSEPDVMLGVKCQISEIRAVSPGYRHSLKVPEDFADKQFAEFAALGDKADPTKDEQSRMYSWFEKYEQCNRGDITKAEFVSRTVVYSELKEADEAVRTAFQGKIDKALETDGYDSAVQEMKIAEANHQHEMMLRVAAKFGWQYTREEYKPWQKEPTKSTTGRSNSTGKSQSRTRCQIPATGPLSSRTRPGNPKYSPDQPRDESGRFGDGSGSSTATEETGSGASPTWSESRDPVEIEKALVSKVSESIESAEGLSEQAKKTYLYAAKAVMNYMPKDALGRLERNMKDVKFYDSCETMTDKLIGNFDQESRDVGKTLGGAFEHEYGRADGTVHLDGGTESTLPRDFYAHEFAHAVDGEPHAAQEGENGYMFTGGGRISDTNKWQDAWESEIKDGALSDYATSEPSEGFAEFARIAWKTPRDAFNMFPKCWAVWEAEGLVMPAPDKWKE